MPIWKEIIDVSIGFTPDFPAAAQGASTTGGMIADWT